MASGSKNKTKGVFQGQSTKRLPRSELDDNTMRDLNRHDNRLDHSLRSVDKAKEVRLKSLESDKHIFMMGGVRSNKKYTTHIKNPGDSRQKRDSVTQPGKYQPDNRIKKPLSGSKATQSNDVNDDSSVQDNGSERDILAETREIIEKQKGDELVENFFAGGKGKNGDSVQQDKPKISPKTSERKSNRNKPTESALESSNGRHEYRSPVTPVVKFDDVGGSIFHDDRIYPARRPLGLSGFQPPPLYDDAAINQGRRPDFWKYLSKPKNPSRSLEKREQLEREFSSPSLKSRATTPAAKSAKGQRTPSSSILSTSATSSTASSSLTGPRGKSATTKKTTTKKPSF